MVFRKKLCDIFGVGGRVPVPRRYGCRGKVRGRRRGFPFGVPIVPQAGMAGSLRCFINASQRRRHVVAWWRLEAPAGGGGPRARRTSGPTDRPTDRRPRVVGERFGRLRRGRLSGKGDRRTRCVGRTATRRPAALRGTVGRACASRSRVRVRRPSTCDARPRWRAYVGGPIRQADARAGSPIAALGARRRRERGRAYGST